MACKHRWRTYNAVDSWVGKLVALLDRLQPSPLHGTGLVHVQTLLNDVELHEPPEAVWRLFQLGFVQAVDVANVANLQQVGHVGAKKRGRGGFRQRRGRGRAEAVSGQVQAWGKLARWNGDTGDSGAEGEGENACWGVEGEGGEGSIPSAQ